MCVITLYCVFVCFQDFATPSLEGEVARGDMEDNPVQDTNNLQQYNIEHRRKWEERYVCL